MVSNKFFAILLVFVLAFSVVVGCSNNNTNNNAGKVVTPEKVEPVVETPKEPEIPAWQTEKITLTVASWENKDYLKKMFDAFTAKYPNITITQDETINWPWTDALTTAASGGKLPDVFRLETVPGAVKNDWLYDITALWDADDETKKIYPNIAATAVYDGKRFALPTGQSYFGVFVNKTLLEKNNIPVPGFDWTIDEMLDIAAKVSNPTEHIYGFSGPWGNLSFNEHWPMANDASLGYNTFDGEKFHFTNQQWIDGYNKKIELRQLKIEEKMTEEEKTKVFGDKGAWPLMKGNVAFGIEGSWNMGWLPGEMEKTGAGIIDFYPYPQGKAGSRMPAVLDFIGMSATTKYPEAAYELMKWISISEEGWKNRIEVMTGMNEAITSFPISDYPEVLTQLEGALKLDGAKAALKLMPTAVPNYDKWLPGFWEFNDWASNQEKIYEKLEKGEFAVADKAKELEDKANQFLTEGKDSLFK